MGSLFSKPKVDKPKPAPIVKPEVIAENDDPEEEAIRRRKANSSFGKSVKAGSRKTSLAGSIDGGVPSASQKKTSLGA